MISKWSIVDPAPIEMEDAGSNSDVQNGAIRNWIMDLQEAIQNGQVTSPESALAYLTSKGCPDAAGVLTQFMMQQPAAQEEANPELPVQNEFPPTEQDENLNVDEQHGQGATPITASDGSKDKDPDEDESDEKGPDPDGVKKDKDSDNDDKESDKEDKRPEWLKEKESAENKLREIKARLRSGKVSFAEMISLDSEALNLEIKIREAKEVSKGRFLPESPRSFSTSVYSQASFGGIDSFINDVPERNEFDVNQFLNEGPELLIADSTDEAVRDSDLMRGLARREAHYEGLSKEQTKEYIERVEDARRSALTTRKVASKKTASYVDNKDNDEGLFL
jgi:hypothetical protein